jgi:dipeptidyl aminopeptidase/acylaminoacyl peptidase
MRYVWSVRFVRVVLLAATLATGLTHAATPGAEPAPKAASPLALTDIISRPKVVDLKVSPDGKHFAGTGVTAEGKTVLHILDRRTMTIVHSEVYGGPLGVGDFSWHDADNLLITSTYKSELAEGRGSAGVFLFNIKTREIRRVWGGEGSTDYGGFEGGDLGARIDDEHYWLTVGPSGSTYSEFPFFYLYKLNIFTGRATKVLKSPSRVASFVFNKDNEVTHSVGLLPDDFDSTVVHRRVGDEWVLEGTYKNPSGTSVPVRWHKWDPNKILYRDNLDAQTVGYYWVDAKTGARELIYRDPRVDVDEVVFDPDDVAIAAKHQYDYPTYVPLKPDHPLVIRRQRLVAAFPEQQISIESSTADGLEHVLRVHGDRDPGQFYLWNEYDGKIRHLLDPRPQVKAANMAKTQAVRFKARDGMELVGYLTVPMHKPAKNLPLVILPHGGPHGVRDSWGYDMEASVFANAGYAVLKVNYRGSGGYGKDFHYKWYRHWGLEMQDDLEDGVLWAAGAGIADIDRVCIYGASYGGYAALMGVVKTPDRYRCAIGYVGVYDLNIMHQFGDISRSKAGQKYLDDALGTDPADRAARSSTPHVDRIKAPVFLVHGMQDDRAHFRHYEEMREALKARNHRFETLLVPRAGHGARDLASVREVSCRMIDFLDRHIGDRKPTDPPNDCQFPGSKKLPYEYFAGGSR